MRRVLTADFAEDLSIAGAGLRAADRAANLADFPAGAFFVGPFATESIAPFAHRGVHFASNTNY
jgi:hypothetical protein